MDPHALRAYNSLPKASPLWLYLRCKPRPLSLEPGNWQHSGRPEFRYGMSLYFVAWMTLGHAETLAALLIPSPPLQNRHEEILALEIVRVHTEPYEQSVGATLHRTCEGQEAVARRGLTPSW